MITYQDLLSAIGEGDARRERDVLDFVKKVIRQHQASDLYQTAQIADEYDRQKNRTITRFQKILYTMSGEAVPDLFGACYRIPSRFFNRFVTQENQYLLGNGVSWDGEENPLGDDFDYVLQDAGKKALCGAVSFGFMNLDHVVVFSVLEFAPLYDEENGALRAGVRFWQIDQTKPLRATLYEEDGYTEMIWRRKTKGEILQPKRKYKLIIRESEADGMEVYDGENYPSFPIVPLWANGHHQSEIVGIREGIDAYDLIKSGAASDIDEAAQIYWVIQNAGGMDDVDLRKFIERLRVVKAATMDEDGAVAEPHTIDIPYEAREAILNRIEKDLYKDFMALDTENIASGATTATQIRAAYEPMSNKVDEFEHCVYKFVDGLLRIAGKDVKFSFTRSMNINVQETVQTIMMAAEHLSDDYVTRKVLTTFGDGDLADDMIREMDAEDMQKINLPPRDEEWTEGTSSQTNE